MRRWLALVLVFMFALAAPGANPQAGEGQTAPEFTLRDIDNKPVSLKDMAGKVTLISFWATWCAPCQVEMPHLQKLYDAYKDQGFVLLMISADDARSVSRVKPLIKSKGYSFPVLLDTDTKVVSQYNPNKTLPYSELIGPDLKVLWQHQGYTAGDEVETERRVKLAIEALAAAKTVAPVSYTHLTLPTSDLV